MLCYVSSLQHAISRAGMMHSIFLTLFVSVAFLFMKQIIVGDDENETDKPVDRT